MKKTEEQKNKELIKTMLDIRSQLKDHGGFDILIVGIEKTVKENII
ncbi:MAG: hypothetical protein ACPGSO_00770 [Vicingaceae bacterium]